MAVCSLSVSSRTARRGARPVAPSVSGMSGSPTTSTTLWGFTNLAPAGIAASVPEIPSGHDRHAGLQRHVGRAVEQLLDLGAAWRVPSGNMTSDSPWPSTFRQVRSDSRSAVPRWTGKAPSIDTNRPSCFDFQIEALPM